MISAHGKNQPLCLLLLGGFGLAFAALGAIYLTSAVGVTTAKMKQLRACVCDRFDDMQRCERQFSGLTPHAGSSGSASGRSSNSTSGSSMSDAIPGFESIMSDNIGARQNGKQQQPPGYRPTPVREELRKKVCRNIDREFTAGYLAVILGLLQFAVVIHSVGAETSSGGKSLVSIIFLGLIVAGTITVCSCILHVYVDVTEDSRKLITPGSQEVLVGYFGVNGSIIGGNAITYSLGYFALVLVIVQICGIVALALRPSPQPIMSMA